MCKEELKKYLKDQITIEDLIFSYEKKDQQKGVVYTPRHIADYMVEKLDPSPSETILDPSVGHGIFLISLLDFMESKVKNLKEYFLTKVTAYDIEDLNELKEILKAYFKQKGYEVGLEEFVNIRRQNTLVSRQNFDCIIGNPPYIRFQNLEPDTRAFLKENFLSCEKGNIDIYYAFIEFANSHSKRSILITPNTWRYTKSGTILREIIQSNLYYIKEYNKTEVFDNAGIFTTILYLKEGFAGSFTLDKEDGGDFHFNFEKIKVKKIHTPIATLRDKIFIKETSDSIPFFKLSKVKNEEEFLSQKKSIIFPYDDDFKIKKLNNDTLEYLKKHKTELEKRDRGKKTYEAWYAYGRRQGFSKKHIDSKLIPIPGMIAPDYQFFSVETKKIGEKFLFSSGFLIEVENDKQILEFLNSEDFRNFMRSAGKFWKGDYYSLSKKQLLMVFEALK